MLLIGSGECVRLKNGVVNAEILENTIENCGIHDYKFDSNDKNGEAIYIGTSNKQVSSADIRRRSHVRELCEPDDDNFTRLANYHVRQDSYTFRIPSNN